MAGLSKLFVAVLAICTLAFGAPRAASAQNIKTDGSLGKALTLQGPNYVIGADLGKQVGGNLFHSFGQFNLVHTSPVPESATFTPAGGTPPISNVIGRVTGGNPSSIDGTINGITGASLYLINPSGIVFGPNGKVNVSGSFHASTADYLKMSDGTLFQATKPGSSTAPANTIVTASPAAFGFLTASPARILVNGSMLGVPSGQALGLVGGPVAITGATLSAPAGTIHVTSAAGIGEVSVAPLDAPALPVTSFGPVGIGSSKLNVSDPTALGSGGSVFIRSGRC